ncbi:hypothetical protein DVS28_a2930 [Euzebya pacifica]|uniref:Uncharacterized protein n=1 Tax=Euzebya pacifica TaxID=1608957 RepID=A0A346XZG2_9ACTN|nr:hypothetical protein DVS28_a2930 [Euzebya pacifica]
MALLTGPFLVALAIGIVVIATWSSLPATVIASEVGFLISPRLPRMGRFGVLPEAFTYDSCRMIDSPDDSDLVVIRDWRYIKFGVELSDADRQWVQDRLAARVGT